MLPTNMAADSDSSVIARRFQDIIAAVAVDQGGENRISEARLQLVGRFAAAAILTERMKARLVSGMEIDVNKYVLICNTLVRRRCVLAGKVYVQNETN